jgi:hypothetical protein
VRFPSVPVVRLRLPSLLCGPNLNCAVSAFGARVAVKRGWLVLRTFLAQELLTVRNRTSEAVSQRPG